VRLHYVSRGSRRVHTEVFAYGLADGHWHAMAVTLSGSQARLFVDCRLVYTRTLAAGPADTSFTGSPDLYVGQRNKGVHSVFKVRWPFTVVSISLGITRWLVGHHRTDASPTSLSWQSITVVLQKCRHIAVRLYVSFTTWHAVQFSRDTLDSTKCRFVWRQILSKLSVNRLVAVPRW